MALANLTGHGRLYILSPLTIEDNSSTVAKNSPINVTQSTSASSSANMSNVDCSVNSISIIHHSPGKESFTHDIPPAVIASMNDKLLGQAVMEHADLQPSFYPEHKVSIHTCMHTFMHIHTHNMRYVSTICTCM